MSLTLLCDYGIYKQIYIAKCYGEALIGFNEAKTDENIWLF